MSDDRMVHPNSPVHFEHWCGHEGCKRWGSFGKERSRGETEWRCIEHLAPDYLDGGKQRAKDAGLHGKNGLSS